MVMDYNTWYRQSDFANANNIDGRQKGTQGFESLARQRYNEYLQSQENGSVTGTATYNLMTGESKTFVKTSPNTPSQLVAYRVYDTKQALPNRPISFSEDAKYEIEEKRDVEGRVLDVKIVPKSSGTTKTVNFSSYQPSFYKKVDEPVNLMNDFIITRGEQNSMNLITTPDKTASINLFGKTLTINNKDIPASINWSNVKEWGSGVGFGFVSSMVNTGISINTGSIAGTDFLKKTTPFNSVSELMNWEMKRSSKLKAEGISAGISAEKTAKQIFVAGSIGFGVNYFAGLSLAPQVVPVTYAITKVSDFTTSTGGTAFLTNTATQTSVKFLFDTISKGVGLGAGSGTYNLLSSGNANVNINPFNTMNFIKPVLPSFSSPFVNDINIDFPFVNRKKDNVVVDLPYPSPSMINFPSVNRESYGFNTPSVNDTGFVNKFPNVNDNPTKFINNNINSISNVNNYGYGFNYGYGNQFSNKFDFRFETPSLPIPNFRWDTSGLFNLGKDVFKSERGKTAYTPSLYGIVTGLKTSREPKTSYYTGLEIRPMVLPKFKKKKKGWLFY